MTEVSHKSPFDDIAFLDPLQSQHPVQTAALTPTALTPTSSQYHVSDGRERQPPSQEPSSYSLPMSVASSATTRPLTSNGKQNNLDAFAALVAPPSPPKTSTFAAMLPQDHERALFDTSPYSKSHTNISRPLHRRTESVSSQQSDFGAFVSVPTSEDPLSAELWDFDEQQQLPVPETPTTATPADSTQNRHPGANEQELGSQPTSSLPPPPRPPSRSSASSVSINTTSSSSQNPSTLSFFDQFAHNAKERSQARSSLLLNELLLHQDDPLYFLKDQESDKHESDPPAGPAPVFSPSLLSPPLIPLPVSTSIPSSSLAPPDSAASSKPVSSPSVTAVTSPQPQRQHPQSLLDVVDLNDDLDHDYFRVAASSSQADPSTPHKQYTLPSHLRSPPTRSSSIPVPVPTLAPPVESPEGAVRSQPRSPPAAATYVVSHHLATSPSATTSDWRSDAASGHPHKDGWEDGNIPKLTKKASFSLPGKWMSTLLRSAPLSGHVAAQTLPTKPSIESVFGASSSSEGEGATPPSRSTSPPPSSSSQMTASTKSGMEQPALQRRSSTSPSRKRTPQQPTFTHSNPFAPPSQPASVIHGPSPFAPHVYIPPTGAPGFTGEHYTWDKGFSEELEAERERERGRKEVKPGPHVNVKAKTVPGLGKENEPEDSPGRSSSASGSKASTGWGSGFGFSFGTIRGSSGNSKGKLAPSSSSGSGSRVSPSSSFIASNGSTKALSTHSSESVSDHSSFFAHERAVSSPAEMRQFEGPKELAGEAAPGRGQKGIEGIGAFIERKSGNIELLGRKAATAPVLTTELAGLIRPHLPALSRLPRSWTLVYSLDQDGISLNTLYTRCEAHATRRPAPGEVLANNAAMLVVMRDADGGLFGAWVAEGVRLNKGGKGYFGGGESFLWKYRDHDLKVFKCTGKNNYIALCEPEYISFGGGDGNYGLYLDESLFDGSSAPCPTFNNEPLCSPGPKKGASVTFECVGLEVWGMGP